MLFSPSVGWLTFTSSIITYEGKEVAHQEVVLVTFVTVELGLKMFFS